MMYVARLIHFYNDLLFNKNKFSVLIVLQYFLNESNSDDALNYAKWSVKNSV